MTRLLVYMFTCSYSVAVLTQTAIVVLCFARAEGRADLGLAVMPTRAEKSLLVSDWTLHFKQKVRERKLQAITKKLKDNGFKSILREGLLLKY